MHIANEGVWLGHHSGPFALTRETFQQMCDAFEPQKTPLVVDYEHRGPEGDTRAAGWIHGLEIRDGENGAELWAKPVEWTPAATEMLKTGEYRFCSGWFATTGAVDRVSGKVGGARLFNVALTNMPFIDGQHAIKLSYTPALVSAAGDPAPQESDMPEGLQAFLDQIAQVAGIDSNAALQALLGMADQIGGLIRDSLDSGGSEPATTDKPADPKLAEIEAKAMNNQTQLLLSQLKALTEKVDAITEKETKAAEAARVSKVDGMISEGKLLETERDDALHILASAPERFDRIYGNREGLSKKVPIGVRQAGNEPAKTTEISAGEVSAAVAAMSVGDRSAYQILVRGGYTPERAIKRLAETREKAASRQAG